MGVKKNMRVYMKVPQFITKVLMTIFEKKFECSGRLIHGLHMKNERIWVIIKRGLENVEVGDQKME